MPVITVWNIGWFYKMWTWVFFTFPYVLFHHLQGDWYLFNWICTHLLECVPQTTLSSHSTLSALRCMIFMMHTACYWVTLLYRVYHIHLYVIMLPPPRKHIVFHHHFQLCFTFIKALPLTHTTLTEQHHYSTWCHLTTNPITTPPLHNASAWWLVREAAGCWGTLFS